MRGKRNEPAYVAFIADKIAEIHSTTREQVADVTTANADPPVWLGRLSFEHSHIFYSRTR